MPRKLLLLQTHYSLDGCIAGPNNELLSWITTNFSADLNAAVEAITANVDEILLGRNLAEGFVPAWRARPDSEPGAKFMKGTLKTVFSRTLDEGALGTGENVRVLRGDVEDEVRKLKAQEEGGDMVVYGGVTLVRSLVQAELVDEFFLLVNPVALGEEGMRLFTGRVDLEFVEARGMECGIVLLHYRRRG